MLLCLVRLIWKLVDFRDHMLRAGPQYLFAMTKVRETLWVPTPSLTCLSASYGWHSNQFEQFHSFLGSPTPRQSFSYAREILLFSIPFIYNFIHWANSLIFMFILMLKLKGGCLGTLQAGSCGFV